MYLSYKTLEELLEKPKRVSPRDLVELLTMSVMEVESVKSEAEQFGGVFVGEIMEFNKHPNADKLNVAKVNIGRSKPLQLIFGQMVKMKVGDRVPVAVAPTKLPTGMEIIEKDIRGVRSGGMLCLEQELGFKDIGVSILYFPKVKPGTPIAEALGKNDLVIEVDNKSITHRPDLWGHLGVARELAALWDTKLKMPKLANLKTGSNGLKVEIKNSELCLRYLGVVLSGIKVAPSPAWLRNKVEALGMRSINNVVDAANYVMLEIGQPLHTFGLKKLSSLKIIVRQAKSGELLKTLDGQTRKLPNGALVIADDEGAIALAGIMGGASSEVNEKTNSLVVESAAFNAVSIRQTATKLGLRSEASARFEKALDTELAEIGIKRFVEIMKQIDPNVKVASDLVDEYPKKLKPVVINVNPDWINERLGTQIKHSEIKNILANLGFEVNLNSTQPPLKIRGGAGSSYKNSSLKIRGGEGELWSVKVPSWRATRDVTIKEDLLEEVARIYGYRKITATLPSFPITQPEVDESQALKQKIRDVLVGTGFTETLSYSFVSDRDLTNFGLQIKGKHITSELSIELENSTDQGKPYLRPTILPNFLKQAGLNSQKHKDIKIFEIGRVFIEEAGDYSKGPRGGSLPKQPYHLGIVLGLMRKSKLDCYREMVGIVTQFAQDLGIHFEFKVAQKVIHNWFDKNMAIDVIFNNQTVGHVGILTENLCRELDLPGVVSVVELSIDELVIGPVSPSQPPPSYPEVVRDLSIILPDNVTWEEIKKEISSLPLLESVETFDVYTPKRSVAFTVIFRALDRTLTSEEVDKIVDQIKKTLTNKFKVEVRDH